MSDMKLIPLQQGTRVTIREGGKNIRAIVNGDPYVVAIEGIEPTSVGCRIPVHVPDGNRNLDVAGENLYCIGDSVAVAT